MFVLLGGAGVFLVWWIRYICYIDSKIRLKNALILASRHEWSAALASIRGGRLGVHRAIAKSPSYRYLLGFLLLNTGEIAEGTRLMEGAVQEDPRLASRDITKCFDHEFTVGGGGRVPPVNARMNQIYWVLFAIVAITALLRLLLSLLPKFIV